MDEEFTHVLPANIRKIKFLLLHSSMPIKRMIDQLNYHVMI